MIAARSSVVRLLNGWQICIVLRHTCARMSSLSAQNPHWQQYRREPRVQCLDQFRRGDYDGRLEIVAAPRFVRLVAVSARQNTQAVHTESI